MRKRILKAALMWLTITTLLAFSSCSKQNGPEIQLDTSDPLALAPDVQWAVVTVPYASFRKETSWDAQATTYCKKGEYFPILATTEISAETKIETWYRFEDGWLPDSTLAVYSNKLRAAKAAEQLK